jgi:hypothetical protein
VSRLRSRLVTGQPPLAKSEATGSMLGKRRLVEGDGTL